MKFFDPHIHCYSRTTDDYERMSLSGVRAVVEPSFWLGSERRYPGTYFDYFEHILSFEPKRAKQYGIDHYCCIAMNPKEANNLDLAHEVIDGLKRYLLHDRCLAIGEVGFDRITVAEEEVMKRQLKIAKELNMLVMVHTPHQNKREGTERTIHLLKEVGLDPDQVIIDHNNLDTIDLSVAYGGWSAMTIYPTKVSPAQAIEIFARYGTDRMMVNTAADWGPSNPLNVVKTALEMRIKEYAEDVIEKLVWDNPIQFYRQSGKLKLAELEEA
ncbi:TatD family hydrolase [Aneurinibacillus sp. Ricciae_BoGa-3]|uniref:TatD family hydrolase n=1 Tax=Aneurinibacillus sp. Ricciae_BoGa-3 TaxID=3022697 RepID=UPI002340B582|nr:TatD family hydrolase [Aneurinibacillus sp. Ricciae_BoGa-3]WCK56299.1 TatD family hydrolase [Aneurinibacillus sp. Ricciae_BoGa-3]